MISCQLSFRRINAFWKSHKIRCRFECLVYLKGRFNSEVSKLPLKLGWVYGGRSVKITHRREKVQQVASFIEMSLGWPNSLPESWKISNMGLTPNGKITSMKWRRRVFEERGWFIQSWNKQIKNTGQVPRRGLYIAKNVEWAFSATGLSESYSSFPLFDDLSMVYCKGSWLSVRLRNVSSFKYYGIFDLFRQVINCKIII